jgi:hypothetical protein
MAKYSERFHQQTRRRFLRHVGGAAAGVVALALPVGRGDAAPEAMRVAFVGNGMTYWQSYDPSQSVPNVVKEMGSVDRPRIAVDPLTLAFTGATLKEQWELGTWDRIKDLKWDYVVLNDHPVVPLESPEVFHDYLARWTNAVKGIGAKPVLFETWFPAQGQSYYKDHDRGGAPWVPPGGPVAWHQAIQKIFTAAARATGAIVAPVSEAWMQAGGAEPVSLLHSPTDLKHPSLRGVYLTACTVYRTLAGRTISPKSAPSWIDGDVARSYQMIANDVCARQGGVP